MVRRPRLSGVWAASDEGFTTSPSTSHVQRGVSMDSTVAVAQHEQYGLPELWLVDTAADVVLVYRRSTPQAPAFDVCLELARGDVLSSPLLPGFTLPVDELFGPPPGAATG